MKAAISKEPGPPESLVYQDVDEPVCGEGQVLVSVKAVGVNYPDVLIVEDKYQYKPDRPFAPGGEVAGTVKAVGSGVSDLEPGDRVMGFCSWGGMAEEIVIDASRCVRIPDSMPWDEGASLLFTYGTSYYALKNRGNLAPGEKVLVLGAAGGVGLAAVELASAMGAEVIAACSTREKVDLCLSRGASAGVVYASGELDKDAQRELTREIREVAGGGVDIIYDAVGGSYANPALRTMNWEGRYLVVGFPAGVPAIPLNLPLLKSCDIRGVFWGGWVENHLPEFRQSLAELVALYEKGAIRPHVSARFPLEKAAEAICELRDRRAVGKVVVTVGD